jgi:hypothetical protein
MAEIPVPSGGSGYSSSGDRPLGVTILAVLQLLGGIFLLLTATLALLIPFFGLFLAAVIGIVALVYFLVAYGLFAMKSWAWIWAIITNVLGAILNLTSLPGSALGLIINIIVILYLNQGDIKSRFR